MLVPKHRRLVPEMLALGLKIDWERPFCFECLREALNVDAESMRAWREPSHGSESPGLNLLERCAMMCFMQMTEGGPSKNMECVLALVRRGFTCGPNLVKALASSTIHFQNRNCTREILEIVKDPRVFPEDFVAVARKHVRGLLEHAPFIVDLIQDAIDFSDPSTVTGHDLRAVFSVLVRRRMWTCLAELCGRPGYWKCADSLARRQAPLIVSKVLTGKRDEGIRNLSSFARSTWFSTEMLFRMAVRGVVIRGMPPRARLPESGPDGARGAAQR